MSTPQGKDDKYSTPMGVIFVFNLILGTGALTLPFAMQGSGLVPGILLLLILGLFSFMTATFVIEAFAAANAMSRKRYENEAVPLVSEEPQENMFEITEKYEIGQMGVLMTPKWCQIVIYSCLCIYLFGDLAIYEVVIGATAAQIICSFERNVTEKLEADDPCFHNYSITVVNVNRAAIAVFVMLLGPFVFSNVQKTKALQIFTSILRWLAFFVMLIWSIYKLFTVGAQGHAPVFEIEAVPLLFGTSIYSFMCQHSIPGLMYPIRSKGLMTKILAFDFSCVAVFYVTLSITAVNTFDKLYPIYSFNFLEEASQPSTSLFAVILAYFLALFPIFTLSTSFPIIAITLRNNLRSLIVRNAPPVWYYDSLLFPLLTLIPPSILSLSVSDLKILLGVIGSYAGAGVQYLIPCLLVQFARLQTKDFETPNIHLSPFKHNFWPYVVYSWMIISLILITLHYSLHLE